jgi:hypothetical protein
MDTSLGWPDEPDVKSKRDEGRRGRVEDGLFSQPDEEKMNLGCSVSSCSSRAAVGKRMLRGQKTAPILRQVNSKSTS